MFPFFQFLPFGLQVFLTQHFNLGHIPKTGDQEKAKEQVREVRLLSKREFHSMFNGANIFLEKILGFTKSFIVYKVENKS